MATDQITNINADHEDYIEMEVVSSSSSSSNFICYSISSPPKSREFEFQMSSFSHEKESTPSPADELFYKGKLLPLHLPPRLLMVQNLLRTPNTKTSIFEKQSQPAMEAENYTISFISGSTTTTTNTTPLESCNISPSESCRVSSELNPDEYCFKWSSEMSGFINDDQNSKKSWTRKLKQMKKSSLGQKIKASRAYLKSLFSKSGCSDEYCAKTENMISKGNDCLNKCIKIRNNRTPFGKLEKDRYEDGGNSHRKSFSGAIQRHSPMKCLSSSTSSSGSCTSSSSFSSFSFSSNGFYSLQFLKRSSSANSEIESSIEGAIAHCKQSQQPLVTSRMIESESAVCSMSASRITNTADKESNRICSI